MFGLTQHHIYYMYDGVTDMRKGFDGLSGIVLDKMKGNPQDGSVYIFINRRRDRMKLLVWSSQGFTLYYKRLEKGTFELPNTTAQGEKKEINWETLVLIISGISLQKIHKRKRYKRA